MGCFTSVILSNNHAMTSTSACSRWRSCHACIGSPIEVPPPLQHTCWAYAVGGFGKVREERRDEQAGP